MNMTQKTGLSIHVRNSIRRQLIIRLMLMRRLVYHHDPYENEHHSHKIEDIEHLSIEDVSNKDLSIIPPLIYWIIISLLVSFFTNLASNYGAHDDLEEQYDG